MPPRLDASTADLIRRLAGVHHLAVLSDFDGTLAPIVERPEMAALPAETRDLLHRLAQTGRVTVGIISGRSLSDLIARVGIPNLFYAGNHGLEILGPGVDFLHPRAAAQMRDLRTVEEALHASLDAIHGVQIENKGLTLSVHFRGVPHEQVASAERAFETVLRAPVLLGKVRVSSGKMVWEVRPAVKWDKGDAVAMILKRQMRCRPAAPMAALYIGDDRTDEAAFRRINERGGASVYVGEPWRDTAAAYTVRDPREVQILLRDLLRLVEG
jgi:trehalose-phosphatase